MLLKSRLVTKVGFVVIGLMDFYVTWSPEKGGLTTTPSLSCELTFSSVGHSLPLPHLWGSQMDERHKDCNSWETLVFSTLFFFLRDFMCWFVLFWFKGIHSELGFLLPQPWERIFAEWLLITWAPLLWSRGMLQSVTVSGCPCLLVPVLLCYVLKGPWPCLHTLGAVWVNVQCPHLRTWMSALSLCQGVKSLVPLLL